MAGTSPTSMKFNWQRKLACRFVNCVSLVPCIVDGCCQKHAAIFSELPAMTLTKGILLAILNCRTHGASFGVKGDGCCHTLRSAVHRSLVVDRCWCMRLGILVLRCKQGLEQQSEEDAVRGNVVVSVLCCVLASCQMPVPSCGPSV